MPCDLHPEAEYGRARNLRSGVLFSEERERKATRDLTCDQPGLSFFGGTRKYSNARVGGSGKGTKAWLTDWPPSLALLFFRAPPKNERLIAGYSRLGGSVGGQSGFSQTLVFFLAFPNRHSRVAILSRSSEKITPDRRLPCSRIKLH